MTIWRFANYFEPLPADRQTSLGEGDTPLIRSRRIGPRAGLQNLFFKLETANPSGSYKDRFAAAAISQMLAAGKTRCVATSSGNTGSALAAYCAAAGVRCQIAIVETAPLGKLQQMLAYGAEIFRVRGFGIDPHITGRVLEAIQRMGGQPDAALQISAFRYSPAGMSGVRSISHELVEQSPALIDHVFCPAGGGGLTLAVAQGFGQLVAQGKLPRSPRVECVQPEGNNTIAGPLRSGAEQAEAVNCTSQISGLQVASVIDGDEVIPACRKTGGTGHLVSDDAVWDAQQRLAEQEGIFSEPAGAVALAAALQAAEQGEVDPAALVVCLVTGMGFKDPDSVAKMNQRRECPFVELEELEEHA